MKICSVGCVTPLGNSEAEIWKNLNQNNSGSFSSRLTFESPISKRERRRINRFSDMAACATVACYEEIQNKLMEWSQDRVGCIFTTGFGPLETNLNFAKQIITDDPDACSPILFSNTVHNACLGTIAMKLGLTGPSTMMLGSNHLLFSKLLLLEGKADMVLSGCIDEYHEELESTLIANGFSRENVSEAAVVLGITNHTRPELEDLVKIESLHSIFIEGNPYEQVKITKDELKETLQRLLGKKKLDAIIPTDPCSTFGKMEVEILNEICSESTILESFQQYFGHCLGADLGLKILGGKIFLDKGKIPECLCGKNVKQITYNQIAILSADLTGNYTCAVLKKE